MNTESMDRLRDYVERATVVYRKGEVVSESDVNGLHVITIDAFPALPEGVKSVVDCHFVDVGFTEALAEMGHDEFRALIYDNVEGEFTTMTPEDWAGGPSYIAIGGWIGSQTLAFQFMAVCVAHGLTPSVITPERLGITGADADQLAGMGMVMLNGMNVTEVTV